MGVDIFGLKCVSLSLLIFFSQIFYNCKVAGIIQHLICRKMCSKHFENRLTNKQALVKEKK